GEDRRRSDHDAHLMRSRRIRAVVAGAALVVVASACSSSHHAASTTTAARPAGPGPQLVNADGLTDHWHAALGVNIWGTWQPGPIWPSTGPVQGQMTLTRADDPNQYAGLHTHQLANGDSDGLIHMEPASPDEAGTNATLGRYMEFGGWHADASSLQLWP